MKRKIIDLENSLAESVKVKISKSDHDLLLQDAKMFGFSKTNKFLNDLIINYIDEYYQQLEQATSSILIGMEDFSLGRDKNDFAIAARKTALSVCSHSNSYSKDLTSTFSIAIRESSRTAIIETIYKLNPDIQISVFFRSLFKSYLSLPEYKRELIIFKKLVDKLNPLLKKNKIQYVSPGKEPKYLSPYSIEHSNHELRNYLIGESNNNHNIVSIRLMNIEKVYATDEKASFRDDFEVCFNLMSKNGIQFSINEISDKKIKLTKNGYGIFNNRFIDRPVPEKVEKKNDIYELTFRSSQAQLDFYFFPFKDEIII